MRYLITLLAMSLLLLSNTAFAACEGDSSCSSYMTPGVCNGHAPDCIWTESSAAPGGTVSLDNPLGETSSPELLIGKIISAVLGISGSLALLMFVYGGFTWMLSGGNAEKVTKGKNTLVWASIGLVVIFSSYALVNFIFDNLG